MKKIVSKYKIVFETVIAIIAFYLLINLSKTNVDNIYYLVFMPIMAFVATVFYFGNKYHNFNKIISYILALILASITMTSLSFSVYGDSRILGFNWIQTIFILFSLTILFDKCFQLLIALTLKLSTYVGKGKPISWKASFLIIFVLWLVYLIPFLPGNTAGDGNFQLAQFFRHAPMTNHHPFFTTIFEGGIVYIGHSLGSDNLGLFLYVFVQLLICCAIYSYSIYKISLLGFSKKVGYCLSIIVGILPYWSFLSETLHKDALFIAFFAWFTTECTIISCDIFNKNRISKKEIAILTIAALLVSLWRNNGFFLVVPSIFLFVFTNKRKNWKPFLISLLTVSFIYIGFSKAILPVIGVQSTEKRETYSLPVQQTARYLRDHPNDVTTNEQKVLKSTFNNYKNLSKLYNPNIADPVKFNMKDNFNTGAYLKVWLSMGLRHPKTYLEAAYAGTYLYYSPWYKGQNFIWCGTMSGFEFPKYLNLHYLTSTKIRDSFQNILRLIMNIPVFNILTNDALSIWFCILMFAYLWKRNGFLFTIPIFPVLINLSVCIASPVNGMVRYSGCALFATYTLIMYFMFILKFKGDKSE